MKYAPVGRRMLPNERAQVCIDLVRWVPCRTSPIYRINDLREGYRRPLLPEKIEVRCFQIGKQTSGDAAVVMVTATVRGVVNSGVSVIAVGVNFHNPSPNLSRPDPARSPFRRSVPPFHPVKLPVRSVRQGCCLAWHPWWIPSLRPRLAFQAVAAVLPAADELRGQPRPRYLGPRPAPLRRRTGRTLAPPITRVC